MDFKVVIWGLGTNGSNLIDVLGKDNIIAIIDNNSAKLKLGEYKGIPIVSYRSFLKKYRDYYVVVTPMKYQEIEIELNKEGIIKYFIQAKSPASNYLIKTVIDDKFINRFSLDRNKHYKIIGINLFAIYLYQNMKANGMLVEWTDKWDEVIEGVKNEAIRVNSRKIDEIYIDTVSFERKEKGSNVITCFECNDLLYKDWNKDIKKFKNCIDGKRIFIIATGPSIKIEDLELLYQRNEITMSMNGIIYLLEKVRWRPTYYVVSDGIAIRDYEEAYKEKEMMQETDKFFSDNYLKFWDAKHDEKYHCFRQKQQPYHIQFAENCEDGVYAGFSVVYACLQLAVYMGAKKIYLLGCDFNYSNDISAEENHCHNKKKPGYVFDYEKVKQSYRKAKEYAESHEIEIYNATRGGKLEIFERVDFESLFEE